MPTTHEGRGLVVGQVTSFDHKQAEGTIEDTVTFSLSDIYSRQAHSFTLIETENLF